MIDLKAELAKVKAEKARQYRVYVKAVNAVSRARHYSFLGATHRREVQRDLWELGEDAIPIGQGAQVAVSGEAHHDSKLVEQLDALRSMEPAEDGGQQLDEAFGEILDYVREHHATVRPRARLIRIFARLRPWDVTCIVWDERLKRAFTQLGMETPRTGVMRKHRALLDALWERLGKPDTLEEQIWYSLLAKHLSTLPVAQQAIPYEPDIEVETSVFEMRPDATYDPGFWLGRGPEGTLDTPSVDAITEGFDAYSDPGFVLTPGMLPMLHAALTALPARRFVVIGGLSGTGKSTFARIYAQALCADAEIAKPERHIEFVAVRPDWTDPTGLLGHAHLLFDPPRWHDTPALRLLLAAVADPTRPYVLILEEMNLARVEHYFAPLLTAMENPDAGLRLHGLGRLIGDVPPLMPWPRNLFIIGTVNMDATTQAFSDKVLDRAFIWEMDAIDIGEWQVRKRSSEPVSSHLVPVAELLQTLYGPLEEVGRHFGYRVCDEVLAFCDAAGNAEPTTLDAAVFSKVLPRLRGDDQGGLVAALATIRRVCDEGGLTRCVGRIDRMTRALQTTGVARFWS